VVGGWWLVVGGWWLVVGGWCLVSGVWCLVSGVWCLVSGVWCLVSGVWCLVFGVWCLVLFSVIWCLVLFGVRCLVLFGVRLSGVRCSVFGVVWCLVFGVWCWCSVSVGVVRNWSIISGLIFAFLLVFVFYFILPIYASQGTFDLWNHSSPDAYDTMEWITDQAWSKYLPSSVLCACVCVWRSWRACAWSVCVRVLMCACGPCVCVKCVRVLARMCVRACVRGCRSVCGRACACVCMRVHAYVCARACVWWGGCKINVNSIQFYCYFDLVLVKLYLHQECQPMELHAIFRHKPNHLG
jgi:hypothetical protein